LDGVGELIFTIPTGPDAGTFRCTATLLLGGLFVLTAAHCVTDSSGNFVSGTTATVRFEASPDETITVSSFSVHPNWDGNFFLGNDIAVLGLASAPSASVDRFDIDRDGSNDVGSIVNKTGYGRSGTGTTGDTIASGTKRTGLNLYDQTADQMMAALGESHVANSVLQYDFDNGTVAHDAFDFFFNNAQLGVTPLSDEVMSVPGDSGGPSTSNPITGVTSYGVTLSFRTGPPPRTSDVDKDLNSSYGEFAGDTRVSHFASFIDSITGSTTFCGKGSSEFDSIIQGTSGIDIIGGTSGDDLIFGGAGNDHIQGFGGNDCIFGEDGNDRISGGDGNDEISGGLGDDHINGRAGNDTIFGDDGDDVLVGEDGDDTIQGGTGNDHIQGNTGLDDLSGNDGNDVMSGGADDDTVNGNAGNDQLTGRGGNDTVDGGTDTDICDGGGQAGDTVTNCE